MTPARKALVAEHEEIRGRAWVKYFTTAGEYHDVNELGVWYHDTRGSTHLERWPKVCQDLATLRIGGDPP